MFFGHQAEIVTNVFLSFSLNQKTTKKAIICFKTLFISLLQVISGTENLFVSMKSWNTAKNMSITQRMAGQSVSQSNESICSQLVLNDDLRWFQLISPWSSAVWTSPIGIAVEAYRPLFAVLTFKEFFQDLKKIYLSYELAS